MDLKNQQIDFLAIGDMTTDDFIRIKDATVSCDLDRENCRLCVRFGDKVPFESSIVIPAVGNSPNAAVSAHRLGLRSALLAHQGDDDRAAQCLEKLKDEGLDTQHIKSEAGKQSNYHYVLWYEGERTILVKQIEYEYALPNFNTAPRWIYLSSLGSNTLPFHQEIAAYIKNHPETKLAFQPGTFQMSLGYEALKDIYEVSEIFFCNKEEARRILKTDESDIQNLLTAIRELGPKIAVITDGPKGAHASNGSESLYMPMYPDPKPPLERTGAGDAFASTFTSAIALGKSLAEALSWGPINSMSVVQDIGGQRGLLPRERLLGYLDTAPEGYTAQKIT